jgi:hypothetical protein
LQAQSEQELHCPNTTYWTQQKVSKLQLAAMMAGYAQQPVPVERTCMAAGVPVVARCASACMCLFKSRRVDVAAAEVVKQIQQLSRLRHPNITM